MDKNDLLQFLNKIHNKIRNANGIKLTGLAALNEINNFFALYFIKDIVTQKGLGEECSFDKIYEKYASDEVIKKDKDIMPHKSEERMSYKLWEDVYDQGNENDCILKHITTNNYFSPYFANDIVKVSAYSTNSKAFSTIQEIINMIYKKFKGTKFTYKIYDALGDAYERFKTDEISNSGKHTEQHFTPVSIKKIIIDELKPTYKDKFYEPCAGSGGFIHTACHYVYDHDKNNLEKFKKNIYANEINPELQKPLMINMLLHDIQVKNINVNKECDSLSRDNCERYMKKMSKCGTNVPFGMKNNLTNWSNYWDPVESGKNIIKDSTAQFIVHIHNCLVDDGIAGIVVDRGVLNNGADGKKSWQIKFRKWLLEKNDLYKILYMPTGIFEFTNFATAIIFFKKGHKTKKVEFYEATFIDPKKKGDIEVGKKPLKIMTLKEIEKQNWSLKMELEEKEELKAGWVKLGDVFEIDKKTKKYKASDGNEKGLYEFYTCGEKILYRDNYEFKNEHIIINGGGKANIRISQKFSVSNDLHIIHAIEDKYLNKMLYYYLKCNITILNDNMHGGGLKHLSQVNLLNIQIPDLSKTHQQEIVDFLDKQFETYDINKLGDKLKNINLFDLLIYKQYDICADALHLIYRKIETDALHLIYRKIETDALVKSLDRDKKAVFNMMLNGCDYDIVKLGDIVDFDKGTFNTKDIDNSGKYPYYNSGYSNPSGSHSVFTIDKSEYILFVKDGGNKSNPLNENSGMAKPFYVQGKSAVNCHLMIFLNKSKNMIMKWLYYYLNYNRHNAMKKAKYNSGLGSIIKNDIIELQIKLPSLKDQKKIIEEIEKIEKEQETYKKYGDMLQGLIDNMHVVINNITKNKESHKDKKLSKKKIDSDSDTNENENDKHELLKSKKKMIIIKKNVSDDSDDSDDSDKE
jgi:type I restriction-modification system DNA methylase subunit